MYNLNDTIVAISSGTTPATKHIIRISGAKTFDVLKEIAANLTRQRIIVFVPIKIADDLEFDSRIYTFCSPHSYTGEDLAEIHLFTCNEVAEVLLTKILSVGCRAAQPGEFTYRAYINGKIDLSQAEAVAQLIQSSNEYQLAAARRLFDGSIEKIIRQAKQNTLELLSLIEAGIDFSTEDIEILSTDDAIKRAEKICHMLQNLAGGSITYERIMDLPSVIIAGTAGAGKSSLVNALAGKQRSIVSQSNTTRDVLEHWLKLDRCDCILLDCAGIVAKPADTIQALANIATLKAIDDAKVIMFCVDITKKDFSADLLILNQLARTPAIYIATKCDLLPTDEVEKNLEKLKQVFGCDFLATSSKNKLGLEECKKLIQNNLLTYPANITEADSKAILTERHKQAITEAISHIRAAIDELKQNNTETSAMFLRLAIDNLSSFESEHIDEAILDVIFSRFCIGK